MLYRFFDLKIEIVQAPDDFLTPFISEITSIGRLMSINLEKL